MSTVRLKFIFKELNVRRLWNAWTRKSVVSTVVRRYLRGRSIREVIQCFKYTLLRPRRTLLLAATAFNVHNDSGCNYSETGITDDELQSLLLELENVQQLSKMTLYCTGCNKRLIIDRRQEGVDYCGCKEARPLEDSSDGWVPFMETDDVIIWRKEYKPGKGLFVYKVYGRYPEVVASDYAAVQVDGAYRRVWDSAVAALAVVERDARGVPGQSVLHWEVLWPRLFANRDYVYIRRHKEFNIATDRGSPPNANRQQQNANSRQANARNQPSSKFKCPRRTTTVWVMMSRSCEHEAVPETKNAIRVLEYWSHMVVRTLNPADKSGTEFVLTYYDEPATGGMPSGVAAWASSRAAPSYLARMRHAARHYRAWAAGRDTQDLPDFIPLSPDQVNRDKDTTSLEERDMETSKHGPDMENSNGKPNQEPKIGTENKNEKNKDDETKKDEEVKDTKEKEIANEAKEAETKETKDEVSLENEEEKEKHPEEEPSKEWWRYVYPFYYFL